MIPITIAQGGPFLGFVADDLNPLIIGGYKCPRGTKVNLSREKRISMTEIEGASGTIKEMSGLKDWQISIEFLYVPVDNLLIPLELKTIKRMLEIGTNLKVTHKKMNTLDIDYIVVTKLTLPDEENFYELPVQIEAVSDEEIELDASTSSA